MLKAKCDFCSLAHGKFHIYVILCNAKYNASDDDANTLVNVGEAFELLQELEQS